MSRILLRVWAALVLPAVLGACGAAKPAPQLAGREVVVNVPDVEATNLPADEEIDALLKGKVAYGRAKGNLRVAVPPFQLRAQPQVVTAREYMGPSLAELLASRLSHAAGVSVLERGELTKLIEELKRDSANDVTTENATKVAAAGKILGAKLLVIGSLHEIDAERFRAVLKPVRVEDGVILPTVEIEVEASALDKGVDGAATRLLDSVGVNGGAVVAPAKPLSAASLAMAAQARELQYAGKLLDAQPLYEQALAEPSSSWRLEADYVRLMIDLGMNDWAIARASTTLGRMPATPETVCDRATLTTQKARAADIMNAEGAINSAREAVRVSASCGDPAVVGASLLTYANAIDSVNHALAKRALERAIAIVGDKSDWLKCWLSYNLYLGYVDSDGDWQGSRTDNYKKIGDFCEKSGNLRISSNAISSAAASAWSPKERDALYDRALELAKSVGGRTLDAALFANGENLRATGKPSEADEMLLTAIGGHVRAIAALQGTLIDPESRLDADLLRRAKVDKPADPARPLRPGEDLVVKAHRIALARAVQKWADRTLPESQPQADFYRAVAEVMNPSPKETKPKTALEGIERRLEHAKLPLKTILASPSAPLRASGADLAGAFDALTDLYWEVAASPDNTTDVVAAMRKVSAWREAPRDQRESILYEARAYAKANNVGAATERIRAAEKTAKDDPVFVDRVLDVELALVAKADPKRAAEIRKRKVELSNRIGPDAYVEATYQAEDAAWSAGGYDFHLAVTALVKASADLEAKECPSSAAYALVKAARLWNDGTHTDGGDEVVGMYRRRLASIDHLQDPLRSLDARIDVVTAIGHKWSHLYRGGAGAQLKRDPAVRAAMAEIVAQIQQLVQAKQMRDAARAVSKLRSDVPGVIGLTHDALTWSDSFKDSAEFAPLAARLHAGLGEAADGDTEKKREYGLARDLYVQGNDNAQATYMQRKLIVRADDEAEAWSLDARCFEIAGTVATDRDDCVSGMAEYLFKRKRLTQKDKLKSTLAIGLEILPELDRWKAPPARMEYRGDLGAIAAYAGDFAAFERLLLQVRTYYTVTEPDPYQWVTYLWNFATGAAVPDPKRSVALWKEFDAARGASCHWKVSEYYKTAATAHAAGDTKAEKYFLATGRACAAEAGEVDHYAWLYDLEAARAAVPAQEWRAAAEGYRKTLETVQHRNADAPVVQAMLITNRGTALGLAKDFAAAASALKEPVASWVKALDAGETLAAPCAQSDGMEVLASVQMKLGQCAVATKLREAASRAREACRDDAPGDALWGEGPAYTRFRGDNACNQPPALTPAHILD